MRWRRLVPAHLNNSASEQQLHQQPRSDEHPLSKRTTSSRLPNKVQSLRLPLRSQPRGRKCAGRVTGSRTKDRPLRAELPHSLWLPRTVKMYLRRAQIPPTCFFRCGETSERHRCRSRLFLIQRADGHVQRWQPKAPTLHAVRLSRRQQEEICAGRIRPETLRGAGGGQRRPRFTRLGPGCLTCPLVAGTLNSKLDLVARTEDRLAMQAPIKLPTRPTCLRRQTRQLAEAGNPIRCLCLAVYRHARSFFGYARRD